LLDELESDEIDRRAIAMLGTAFFRPQRPSAAIATNASAFSAETLGRFSPEAVAKAVAEASSYVAEVRSKARRREEFHGKEVLRRFYAGHLHRTPLSKVVFAFETARYARKRKATASFFDEFFSKITPSWAAQQAVAADGASPRS
jgi:hypothetical protein